MIDHKETMASVAAKCGVALASCSAVVAWIDANHVFITTSCAIGGVLVTVVASIINAHYRYKEDKRRDAEHRLRLQKTLNLEKPSNGHK